MADHTFRLDHRLMLVEVILSGPKGTFSSEFILDTGASYTIVDYRLAEHLGYSKKDSFSPSCVSSALGKEEGFRIRIETIESLGKKFAPFEVACHSLYEQGVAGLLGMTFLENFDFSILPSKQIIRVE